MSSFRSVLVGAELPLRRWQLLAIADDYGADARTRTKLEQVPDRDYHDSSEVMIAMSMTPAHLAARSPL